MKYLYSLMFTLCTVSTMQASDEIDAYIRGSIESHPQKLSPLFNKHIKNKENSYLIIALFKNPGFRPLESVCYENGYYGTSCKDFIMKHIKNTQDPIIQAFLKRVEPERVKTKQELKQEQELLQDLLQEEEKAELAKAEKELQEKKELQEMKAAKRDTWLDAYILEKEEAEQQKRRNLGYDDPSYKPVWNGKRFE